MPPAAGLSRRYRGRLSHRRSHALGKPVPPYIVVPVFAATKDNLKEAWELAYGSMTPLPAAAQKCLGN
ncbi:hypothetical protein H5P29_31810 (plasmid) [Aminobacter sp. MDW-2]|nr:hypothetical protein [Aminobacter sp. MDW-2]MRX37580.1 hypothetical protein [Aminobacter sp. MDW-2]QNH37890.1 hypothetical protein H5P29_31810 [Aminobacter sp. MDW-2]